MGELTGKSTYYSNWINGSMYLFVTDEKKFGEAVSNCQGYAWNHGNLRAHLLEINSQAEMDLIRKILKNGSHKLKKDYNIGTHPSSISHARRTK